MEPWELTLDFAPRRRANVTSVELEGEAVVYDSDRGTMHKLDPIATVVWRCLDGRVTLRELAGDLREVFEGEADRVAADLLAYVRHLGREGFLEGVESAVMADGEGDGS